MNCPSCNVPAGHQDRFCTQCGAALVAVPAVLDLRKNVVILFTDVVDSTALGERLDPEFLRSVLDQYFAICVQCVAESGGIVEKFIGDAVMAVFGVPRIHEDDALRAVRAAAAIRDALERLNLDLAANGISLEVRTGICSGEVVVTSFPTGDLHIVGDPVNTAARLQAAAAPGQILLTRDAATMVRGRVVLEEVAALRLKGKAERTPAWQLASLAAPEQSGQVSAALVGRVYELEHLQRTYRQVTMQQQCCLVTVLGEAGMGKSRLVREFVTSHHAEDAEILVGHCRAYGSDPTYHAVVQMLDSLAPRITVERLLADEPDGSRAIRCIARLVERSDEDSVDIVGVEEISWAVRKLFEALARRGPVIAVWEDMHSAGSALLDLVDDVATWLIDVPVMLICVARPELLYIRPTWGGGKPCATTLDLAPLTAGQTAELVAELTATGDVMAHLQDGAAERVAAACEGNPLFAELMVDLIADSGSDIAVSPNINALLSARLDQLPADEREVIERAAVVGREFTLDQLCTLLGTGRAVEISDRLTRLSRRRLVRRLDRAGTFRFSQALVCDALYSMIPKSNRKEWHLRLADSITDGADGDYRANSDIVGHHLEKACLLGRELRPGDPELPRLAERAASALIADGLFSLHRKDLPAAAATLERGRNLLPPSHPAHRSLALQICDSWLGLSNAGRALEALSAAEEAMPGDRHTQLTCQAQRLIVAVRSGGAAVDIAVQANRLGTVVAADPDDDLTWCRFHQLTAFLHMFNERLGAVEDELRAALGRARSMADRYEEDRILIGMCELGLWGPTPVSAGLVLCEELTDRFASDRVLLVPVAMADAGLHALVGDIEGARELLTTAKSYVRELHLDLAGAVLTQVSGLVESLAHNHAVAESEYRRGAAALRAAGKVTGAQTLEAWAARELFAQGLIAEATSAAERLELTAEASDLRTQLIVRALRGRLASAGGQHSTAIGILDEAARLAQGTDDLSLQGDLLWDLARVSRSAGKADVVFRTAEKALERFTAKGAELLAARLGAWLSEDRDTSGALRGEL